MNSLSAALLVVFLITLGFNAYLDFRWKGRHERVVKVLSVGFIVFSIVALRWRYMGELSDILEELSEQMKCFTSEGALKAITRVIEDVREQGVGGGWVGTALIAKIGLDLFMILS